MADFDGPTYSISVGSVMGPGYETTSHFVPYWTTQPTFSAVQGFGGGGSPTTPEGDPIYGYGWASNG